MVFKQLKQRRFCFVDRKAEALRPHRRAVKSPEEPGLLTGAAKLTRQKRHLDQSYACRSPVEAIRLAALPSSVN